jgi:hypothetical protein
MSKAQAPKTEIICEADGCPVVVVDGVKIARRGSPGTKHARTWVSLEPGWSVIDVNYPEAIEVSYNGVRVH